ncbi:ribosomal protein L7/L12 [Undibacterium sp. CY18W]|uniref:Ribosomal protein L7/L12 n=1 Tax=Undibacterium hunanense TaxID=2762292 RepID=A0ABR6ZME0_9BURK|nr:ribosomal protein L7/L12 [Undibacterium hunanense]MBC3916718.1 ribosomal protein L7/L12 [Undibacterium hunanense]
MVSDFKCLDCKLQFSVGGYDSHRFWTGYSGFVLSVCRHCGTRHSIEVALHDRGEEFWKIFEIVIDVISEHSRVAMMMQLRQVKQMSLEEARQTINNLPFTFKQELTEDEAKDISEELSVLGIGTTIRVYEHRKNPHFGPLMTNKLRSPGSPNFSDEDEQRTVQLIDFEGNIFLENGDINSSITCAYCHKDQSLVRTWSPECNCPNCQGRLKITSEWIT